MNNNSIYTGAKFDPTSESLEGKQASPLVRQRSVRSRAKQPDRRRKRNASPQKKNVPTAFFVCAALFGGVSFLAGGAWLSIQLILNPDPVGWVNQYLPEETQVPTNDRREPPQTLTQIHGKLRQEGLIPLALMPLGKPGNTNKTDANGPVFLMQVMLETSPPKSLLCQSPCQQLSELRIYQLVPPPHSGTKEQYFSLVAQMPVQGPTESFAIAPLIKSESQKQGSSRPQPLTELTPLQGVAPNTGVWLNATGYRLEGETGLAYGQIFHYNPDTTNFSLMMQWTSPAGKTPVWQEVTGGDKPELVVDQSIGKEPRFEVYQIQPRNFLPNPISIEPISLGQPILAIAPYRQALQLAKSGLWSPAFKLMESLKQQRSESGEDWSEVVQSQMDLVFFHARMTQKQANIAWSDPAEKAFAALIDGRWEEALKLFEADLDNTFKIALMLKADKGAIAKRIEGALKVNPEKTAVKAWKILLKAAQEGKEQTGTWLQELEKDAKATESGMPELLERLSVAFSESTLINHPGKIIGSATPLDAVNSADWLLPKQNVPLQLEKGQSWYEVQVAGFHDGQKWARSPFTNLDLPRIEPGRRLWRVLGLNINPKIQVGVWMSDGQQKLLDATVKAVWYDKGVLKLLAAGDAIANATALGFDESLPRPIAFTADNFRWLQPSSLTLAELNQQQPEWVNAILTNLWGEFQKAGRLPAGAVPNSQEILQQSGNWVVQSIDVNNNNLQDAVITLRSDVFAGLQKPGAAIPEESNLNSARPRTLIFDETGNLIYSEFTASAGQSLTGFGDLEDGEPVALVVDGSNGYSLKRWVEDKQQFE